MRGTHTVVDELRRRVFTEIAKMAYEGGDYKDTIRSLPHKIIPGETAEYYFGAGCGQRTSASGYGPACA